MSLFLQTLKVETATPDLRTLLPILLLHLRYFIYLPQFGFVI
jgi:hypothetical protein